MHATVEKKMKERDKDKILIQVSPSRWPISAAALLISNLTLPGIELSPTQSWFTDSYSYSATYLFTLQSDWLTAMAISSSQDRPTFPVSLPSLLKLGNHPPSPSLTGVSWVSIQDNPSGMDIKVSTENPFIFKLGYLHTLSITTGGWHMGNHL